MGTAWGFACIVEVPEHTLLFDTGSDGPMLVRNIRALGFDPASIDTLVISHEHWDHIGGVDALLDVGARLTVFVPRSFSDEFREGLSARASMIEVDGPRTVAEDISTTGELGVSIIEQSLVVESPQGRVVVTGCAHPGIVEIVRHAAQDGPVAVVLGGFHLKDSDQQQCDAVVAELRALGVEQVAPTHCTGDHAIERFEATFGERCIRVGVGSVLELEG